MFSSPFKSEKININPDALVVFVSDMFASEYVGGAELTTQALIDYCPFPYQLIKSADVTMKLLESGVEKYWVFGNYSSIDYNLIPSIIGNLNYSVLEYDYKFCKYRSPEKHEYSESKPCDCHESQTGKLISAFYYGAQSLWWMSEKQQSRYIKYFPFLQEKQNTILSSVFDDNFFAFIKTLNSKNTTKSGWIVLGSNSWIKGAEAAEKWCVDNSLDYEVVWGLPYEKLLEKLSSAEGFVYLPEGGDTCPRMVIEAKLLGCKLHLNENVEHRNEEWFSSEDMFDAEAYLFAARERFWSSVKMSMEWKPTVSAYTTTKDCIDQNYPWKQCITSMLGFANEVVVVDGGSKDGTWKQLLEWSEKEPRLKVHQVLRDWESKRHAVFDGLQKAEARSLCTQEFLWQQDADEVVHEGDYHKISRLCRNFPRQSVLVALPVIEYWGSQEKVRCDINPWKWRLSRNIPQITHGIPGNLRKYDSDGEIYAEQGTDGCDYIHSENYSVIPHASFYTEESHNVRMRALLGDNGALKVYSEWFNNVIDQLPGVHHYSWIDIPRKIKTYKNYWSKHWMSLFDISQEDTAENNMFFDKPWSDVSSEEIESLAEDLKNKLGGWIFHKKVDLNSSVPHITVPRPQPKVMND
jgi:glycosyltransferase involved in cell wall biosynthesis